MRWIAPCLLIATSAAAEPRAGDTQLTATALRDLLGGQVVEFYDGSKSRYGADGGYGYTYTDDGPVWRGRYSTHDDSRVCVDFQNGSARCDWIVRDGERVVLITKDGTRFPIRNIFVDVD